MRKANDTAVDTVLRAYVKSGESPISQEEYDAVEQIKRSGGPSRSEKFAAIGLSLVEQSVMKYAGNSGIYFQPDEHAALHTVKEHAVKGNIDAYEFIEVTKEVRFDVDITKQRLHIVGLYELDKKERNLQVPCIRVGQYTTWLKQPSVDDLMKYRGCKEETTRTDCIHSLIL